MSNEQRPQVGRWQGRLLRATMPIGIALLVLWFGWMAVAIAKGGVEAWWWGSSIIGLVGALILIGTGWNYRRILSK